MKTIIKVLAVSGAAAAAFGIDNRLQKSYYEIASPKIPDDFDGFCIVHVSDYHCEIMTGLADAVSDENPDIIVSTGDMINNRGSFVPAVELTKKLSHIAPLYMVTGNHDVWRADSGSFLRDSEAAGGMYLHNESIYITKNKSRIMISGMDDPFSRSNPVIARNMKKALSELKYNEDMFHILLYHRANLFDQLKGRGFDLVLAGHMHGGQIRIPGIGGAFAPKTSLVDTSSLFFPKYFGGEYAEDDTTMIVSRGLGNPSIIPRIYNRPELVCITLRHSSK